MTRYKQRAENSVQPTGSTKRMLSVNLNDEVVQSWFSSEDSKQGVPATASHQIRVGQNVCGG